MPQLDKFIFFSQLFWLLLILLPLYLLLVGLLLPRLLRTLKVRRIRAVRWAQVSTGTVETFSSVALEQLRQASFATFALILERLLDGQIRSVRQAAVRPLSLVLPPSFPAPLPSLLVATPRIPSSPPAGLLLSTLLRIAPLPPRSIPPSLLVRSALALHPAAVATPTLSSPPSPLFYTSAKQLVHRLLSTPLPVSVPSVPVLMPSLALYFDRFAQELLYSIDPARFIQVYSEHPRLHRLIKLPAPVLSVKTARALRSTERALLFSRIPSLISRLKPHEPLLPICRNRSPSTSSSPSGGTE